MKRLLAMSLLAISSAAYAQQPGFVPYSITEQTHQGLLNWLTENPIPPKYANPIINQLNQLEQQAQMSAVAEAAKKKTTETNPMPPNIPHPPMPPEKK